MPRGSVFRICSLGASVRRLLVILVAMGLVYLAAMNFSYFDKSSSPYTIKRQTEQSLFDEAILQATSEKYRERVTATMAINLDDLNSANFSAPDNETNAGDFLGRDLEIMETAFGSSSSLPLCPDLEEIKDYAGHMGQSSLLIEDLTESEIADFHPEVEGGGHWKPKECRARHKVAIIVPFRDRQSHLTRLLDFLIPILQKQQLDFRFIVTEQHGEDLFNKGRIMNAAFRLAQKLNVDCVVFHDVDMFPQDDRTPYSCPPTPRHIGAFVNTLAYQLWYKEIVGGALAISIHDYLAVNGYSNMYWAWGGEDDDFGKRILSNNYTIERPDQTYARYSMLKHVKRKRTAPKMIYKLLDSAGTRWISDGVNETGRWTVMNVKVKPLYYHMMVDVGTPPPEWRASA